MTGGRAYDRCMGDLVPIRPASGQSQPDGRRSLGERPAVEPLWREATGGMFRDRRHARGETLRETAGRAGVSTQYLSEIERGRKDASSEVLSAIVGALDLSLLDLTVGVARRLSTFTGSGPARPAVRGPLALAA